ncbi:Galactose oxidase [Balamuthia mandrillaris]
MNERRETSTLTKGIVVRLLVLVLFFLARVHARNRLGPWFPREPSPTAHIEGPVAIINGEYYTFGGFYDKGVGGNYWATNELHIYNIQRDEWRYGANGPLNITHTQGATDGVRFLWFAGGFVGDHPGVATVETWRYDAYFDEWIRGPDLPQPRASSALVYDPIAQELHLIGGLHIDRQTNVQNHMVLSVSDALSWSDATADIIYHRQWLMLPKGGLHSRNHYQGVYLEDSIYTVGGQYGHDITIEDVDALDRFDLERKVWVPLENMPEPRSHMEASITLVNGHLIFAGGRNNIAGKDQTNTVYEYEPHCGKSSCWSSLPDLPFYGDTIGVAFFRNVTIPRGKGVQTGDYLFVNSARVPRPKRGVKLIADSWMARVRLSP